MLNKFKWFYEEKYKKNNNVIKLNNKLNFLDDKIINKVWDLILRFRNDRQFNKKILFLSWFMGTTFLTIFMIDAGNINHKMKFLMTNKMVD